MNLDKNGLPSEGAIRVRMAPAPTGMFHVGSARTALFNWLFARGCGGKFILRIEDTDLIRSTPEATSEIVQALRYLGLDWDEGPEVGGDYGPYLQSQRLDRYREQAERLLAQGAAYPCYCLPDELKQRRQEMQSRGEEPKYDRKCRQLSESDRKQLEGEGRSPALRFAMPDSGATSFRDLIRGVVEFQNALLDDFVIMKSDGRPTYNFAVVVDDTDMAISHVIRGEDLLSSTPRQLLLCQALGISPPQFAHLPLLLGSDRAKLSKRHGATALTWYRDEGYLPEAMVNFLALLGWSPGEDREIFSRQELIERFSLEGVGKSGSVFDLEKLQWMNGHYLRTCSLSRLTDLALPYLQKDGLMPQQISSELRQYAEQVIGLEQERAKVLSEIPGLTEFFFQEDFPYDPKAVKKRLATPEAIDLLERVRDKLESLEQFDQASVEQAIRELIAELGISGGQVIHPVRVALSGRAVGPGLFEMIEVLGKERTLSRLDRAIKTFREVAANSRREHP